MTRTPSRRRFLAGGAALAASAFLGTAPKAGAQGKKQGSAARPLPNRGEYVIRNAYVMTMERGTGDIAGGVLAVDVTHRIETARRPAQNPHLIAARH